MGQELRKDDARQGVRVKGMRLVLVTSVALAVVVMIIVAVLAG